MDYFFGFKSVISGSQPEAEPSPSDTVKMCYICVNKRQSVVAMQIKADKKRINI